MCHLGKMRELECISLVHIEVSGESGKALGRREREGRERDLIQEDKTMLGHFCIYLPMRCHMACHIGFGCLRGVFGTLDGPLNTV